MSNRRSDGAVAPEKQPRWGQEPMPVNTESLVNFRMGFHASNPEIAVLFLRTIGEGEQLHERGVAVSRAMLFGIVEYLADTLMASMAGGVPNECKN